MTIYLLGNKYFATKTYFPTTLTVVPPKTAKSTLSGNLNKKTKDTHFVEKGVGSERNP